MKTYAVITTHNRHDMLTQLIDDVEDQVEAVVVVDHQSDPAVSLDDRVIVLRDDDEPNISRLWNRGLDAVHVIAAGEPYNVIVMNDDLRVHPWAIGALSDALRKTGAAIASPDKSGSLRANETVVDRTVGPKNLHHRMCGYCFMLKGELELRLNETLVWWYGDDDLEWRACGLAGVVRVGGKLVRHLDPNGSMVENGDLGVQAGKDRGTFVEIWGKAPW